MVAFHEALHAPGSKTDTGDSLPKVLDGHDHEEETGPPTQIAVGSHLVHEHGMSQAEVAAMTPAQFKAHHEQLHLKQSEFDVGHGHVHPGGPMRDPRVILPNTHHQAMRDNDRHPAVQEWYHGTGTDYEGPPKNATELKSTEGFWGNFGGGDWNNHVGSHWSSLHQMSRNFNGGGNRVIHAKLHIKNPIVYNSLNHMAHDAYDRLHASGHLQDDGQFFQNHHDDPGYDSDTGACCSNRLLEYAKGHHRDDGKFGLEAYRDSLRASGYDGIHVRNHADNPQGHWNAIPLSADQIEITHGGCRGHHGDERDDDVEEFNSNYSKLTKGWQHPKPFNSQDYVGHRLDHLPTADEVQKAHEEKHQLPQTNKTAVGRGDSDPYLGHPPEDDPDDEQNQYCDHCADYTSHSTDDCTVSKWCSVCEAHGDHQAADAHDYCDHCGDYADHDTDGCTENPDNWAKEAYCPHCDTKDKHNEHSESCVNCGQKLPDWGKLMTFGKPVKAGEYTADGETDAVSYGPASEAKMTGVKDGHDLAAHLYHHHKSDVSGPEFDTKGDWDTEALMHHHQWLHANPENATSRGFVVDHKHKTAFGEFKKEMTPQETHAHMLLSHVGNQGGPAGFGLSDVAKMTPEEAVEAHKKAHDADNAVKWGSKDSSGDLIPKITHTHNLDEDPPGWAEQEPHVPKGDDLIAHMGDKQFHLKKVPDVLKKAFDKNPGLAEELHKQMHNNFGPSAAPNGSVYHVHGPELEKQIAQKKAIVDHLTQHHGADAAHYMVAGKSMDELMKLHGQEHQGSFPTFDDPSHTHFGGTAHADPEGHSDATMKKTPSKIDKIKQHLKEHHGAEPGGAWEDEPLPKLVKIHSGEHGQFPMLGDPQHEHTGLDNFTFTGDHLVHTNETMKSKDGTFDYLKSQSHKELLTSDSGYGMENHLHYHHPEVSKSLQKSEGFDYSPATPAFQEALKEAHEAHMKAHAEGVADHTHGEGHKEASLQTLTDLFEEVAL